MIGNNDLFQRKGILIVSRELILKSDENTLSEVFSNFFPIDADRHHKSEYWDSILYYGVSPHFEKVEEGCICPQYSIILDITDKGIVKFNCFKIIEDEQLRASISKH